MTAKPVSSDLLQKIPLFAGMNETESRQLAEIAAIAEFKPGDLVMVEGQNSQNLWVVLEGQAEVVKTLPPENGEQAEELVLAALDRHQVFGEMSFFHLAPHSASVRAKTPLKLLQIDRGDYEELIQDGAWGAYKLAFNVVATMAERLRRMGDWVAELQRASQDSAPTAVGPPEAVKSHNRVSEWNSFRTKLFEGWNL
jgi:CRP-like cAMP-binding protein